MRNVLRPSGFVHQLALDIGLSLSPTLQGLRTGAHADAVDHLQRWIECFDGQNTTHTDAHVTVPRPSAPVYLWGEAGAGKTHLLRAVAGTLRQRGASFGWLDASAQRPLTAYRDDWSVIFMDDVQAFDAATQQMAFNWFVNAMAPADGPARGILTCGNLPPADLDLRDDLRSRFAWGDVFHLQAPDETGRRAALRHQAEERGMVLPDEVLDFMLHRFSRDLGSLIELLDSLDRYALRTQRAITVPLIRSMMENA